jgi:ABC-type oligopeptide transport system ATPase subunit
MSCSPASGARLKGAAAPARAGRDRRQPTFVVYDEPTSALDIPVQAQIISLLSDRQDSLGVGYPFISHSLATVRHIADRVGVMYLGKIVEEGRRSALLAVISTRRQAQ